MVVGYIPVIVVPELQLTVQGSASTTASEKAEVSTGATGTAGLSYADGKTIKSSSLAFTHSGQQPTLSASGDAKPSIGADVTMAIYGTGGPTIGIEPGLDLKADRGATPWWTLDATLAASASPHIPALDISTPAIQFFNPPLRYEVAHATTPSGSVVFSKAPGTAAPPSKFGPYSMKSFAADSQADGDVSGVQGPTGTVSFAPDLTHSTVDSGWQTWSNGYQGDVYATQHLGGAGMRPKYPMPDGASVFAQAGGCIPKCRCRNRAWCRSRLSVNGPPIAM